MCGIMFVKNLADSGRINDLARVIYEGQKGRGSEGFGVVALSADYHYTNKWVCEADFLNNLAGLDYSEMMIHNRFPTSTENRLDSCHPFVIKTGGKIYSVIHNGVIWNAEELRKKHVKTGIRYASWKAYSFNDSEALAYEFVKYLINGSVIEAKGSCALMCLVQDEATGRAERMYFYRNESNPIKMIKTGSVLVLSSEGGGDMVKVDTLFAYDYNLKEIIEIGTLKIDSGRSWDKWANESWAGYDDEIGFKTRAWGQSEKIIDSVVNYEQAIMALEMLADDYKMIEDSDLIEDKIEADDILCEARDIMEAYAIGEGHLAGLGIDLQVGKQLELLEA